MLLVLLYRVCLFIIFFTSTSLIETEIRFVSNWQKCLLHQVLISLPFAFFFSPPSNPPPLTPSLFSFVFLPFSYVLDFFPIFSLYIYIYISLCLSLKLCFNILMMMMMIIIIISGASEWMVAVSYRHKWFDSQLFLYRHNLSNVFQRPEFSNRREPFTWNKCCNVIVIMMMT